MKFGWKKMPQNTVPTVSAQDNRTYGDQFYNHLPAIFARYGDIVRISKHKNYYALNDADALKYLSKDNNANYDKEFPEYKRVERMFGGGLLTTTGKKWWHRRKLLQPFFTHKAMPDVASVAKEKAEALAQRWHKKYAASQEPFELGPELLACVLQVSVQTLFSESLSFRQARRIVTHYTLGQKAVCSTLSISPWWPGYNNLRLRYHRFWVKRYAQRLLRKRRQQPVGSDMLSALINGTDGMTGKPLTETEIINEIQTFLGTGHETTGNGVLWSLILLMQHPSVAQTLLEALDSADRDNRTAGVDLMKDPYNIAVFKESMRLYPPIWGFARRLINDDVLCGHTVPKESCLVLSAHAFHRHPKYWQDPEVFKPERFLGDCPEPSHKYAYLPFGAGAHTCIAAQFSMAQGPVIVATLMKHFEFDLMSNDLDRLMLLTTRPKYPIFVRVRARSGSAFIAPS